MAAFVVSWYPIEERGRLCSIGYIGISVKLEKNKELVCLYCSLKTEFKLLINNNHSRQEVLYLRSFLACCYITRIDGMLYFISSPFCWLCGGFYL